MTTDDAVNEELAAQHPYDDYEPIGRVLAVWTVVFAVFIYAGFKHAWWAIGALLLVAAVASAVSFGSKRGEGSL